MTMAHLLLILVFGTAPREGKTIAQLIAELDDFSTDRAAAQALRQAGPRALPTLLKAFKPGQSHSRDTIALILGDLARDHVPAKQALLRALESEAEDPGVRANCALGLRSLANKDPAVLKAFLKALDEKDADVRVGVAEAFRRMNERPKAAIPALLKSLKDTDCRVRTAAACTVAETVHVQIAAPAMLESLQGFEAGPTMDSRWREIANALGDMGADVVPFLVKALSHEEKMVREGALVALGKAMALEATSAILKLLQDKEPEVRLNACQTLSTFALHFRMVLGQPREWAPGVVTALIRVLDDKDIEVHREATRALRYMGAAAARAVPRLIQDLKDKRALIRCEAAGALFFIGPAAKAAVPALIEALKDEDRTYRRQAIATLGCIGPDAKGALPALSQLQGEDDLVRWSIDRILGRASPLLQPILARPRR
jgi:HEAT repeat protein